MADDTNIKAFEQFNDQINRNIIQNPQFAVIEASGNTRRSVLDSANVTINSSRFVKRVVSYFEEIDKGRGPNTSDSGGLFTGMFDWLQYRKYGFEWKDVSDRTSKAIALMKKTADKGSFKFRNSSKRTDIFGGAVNRALPDLIKNLITLNTIRVSGAISKSFKK